MINPINKKDNKYFQYAITLALNHKEIKKDPQIIAQIKLFIKKYNCTLQMFYQKKMTGKKLRKIM